MTTPEQLEAAITPKTKMMWFSSPCNPSGSVYSREELAGLVEEDRIVVIPINKRFNIR